MEDVFGECRYLEDTRSFFNWGNRSSLTSLDVLLSPPLNSMEIPLGNSDGRARYLQLFEVTTIGAIAGCHQMKVCS